MRVSKCRIVSGATLIHASAASRFRKIATLRDVPPESLPQLEEVETMLSENVREWTAGWVEEGREQGLEQGRAEGREQGRALLCRQAARKFDADAARRLAAVLAEVTDPERLAQVGDWLIECGTAAELFARVADAPGPETERFRDG